MLYEAHPDAAIFPMMSADDLANLAEDIKEHGLAHPIVIGKIEAEPGVTKEVIVDGRNRYEACQIAGVEPKFVELSGHDPKAFILSSNIARRHMTAGQRAMAYARIYPAPEKGGRGKLAKIGEFTGVTHQRVADARLILQRAPDLADNVLAGGLLISKAVEDARAREGAAGTEEARMLRLRKEAPDLADLVIEGRMSLTEAVAAAKDRVDKLESERRLISEGVMETLDFFEHTNVEPKDRAAIIIEAFDPKLASTFGTRKFSVARIRRAIVAMTIVFAAIAQGGGNVVTEE